MQGFKLLCEECMPKMGISTATKTSVIAYLEKYWLAPKWRRAWTDFGRAKYGVPFFMSCNNALERYWQEFKKDAQSDPKAIRRIDRESEWVRVARALANAEPDGRISTTCSRP
jgi:hypothetical protein